MTTILDGVFLQGTKDRPLIYSKNFGRHFSKNICTFYILGTPPVGIYAIAKGLIKITLCDGTFYCTSDSDY